MYGVVFLVESVGGATSLPWLRKELSGEHSMNCSKSCDWKWSRHSKQLNLPNPIENAKSLRSQLMLRIVFASLGQSMNSLFLAEFALQGMGQARTAWAQERDEIKERMKQWMASSERE